MFTGSIVWKGIVYSILMILAKAMVSIVLYLEYFMRKRKAKPAFRWWGKKRSSPSNSIQMRANSQQREISHTDSSAPLELVTGPPHSMALLIGLAMVARGEIGFLIASLSQSSGTLTLRRKGSMKFDSSGEEIFLVIVWAAVICTIVGPLGVGITVRRLRGLIPTDSTI